MEENKKRKQKKVILTMAALFLILAAAGGGYYWYNSTRYVKTDDARISGTIVSVNSKISGRISQMLVAEGDSVKAGQVLVKLDPRDILVQQAQAEAALAAARANYEQLIHGPRPQEIRQARASAAQAQATLDNAAVNYQRLEKLFQEGAISTAQRDNVRTAYQVAAENFQAASQALDLALTGNRPEAIQAAGAQVKQLEAAVTAAGLNYAETAIVSPVDGTIAQKSVNPGEVVVQGQPLLSVVSTSDLWVNARIEETYIGKLQLGQQVEYTIDGYPTRTFTGKVFEVGTATNSVFTLIPTENASNNFTKVTQRIPIKISLPEHSDVIFRPGMSAVIKVYVK